MSDTKPLHVQVAEALGWTCYTEFDGQETEWWKVRESCQPSLVSRYDTDWAATGPLVDKQRRSGWNYVLQCENGGDWLACLSDIGQNRPHERYDGKGPTSLIAVCNLILALKAAGKLEAA